MTVIHHRLTNTPFKIPLTLFRHLPTSVTGKTHHGISPQQHGHLITTQVLATANSQIHQPAN